MENTLANYLDPRVPEEEKRRKLGLFMLMEVMRGKLRTDRAPYEPLMYDIQRILDPHLVIWDMSNSGFPDFVNDILLSSKPLQAFDDMVAGLQSGITPAEQEWFRMGLEDSENPLGEQQNVQDYLHAVTRYLQNILIKSNFYSQVPALFRSVSRYLTGSMTMERDDKNVVNFTVLPIGSFFVSNNKYGLVDTLCREFQLTVRQIVEQFCTDPITGEVDLTNASDLVRNYWLAGPVPDMKTSQGQNREYRVNVINMIWPNPEYDPKRAKYDPKYKRYACKYYEMTNNNSDRLLYEGGFDFFPNYTVRWFRQPSDAYGVDGPGNKARGDIQQMYESIRMMLNAIAKVVEPPMMADPSAAGLPLATTPAFLSIVPGGVKEGKFGPAYQIQPDLKEIRALIEDLKRDIDHICLADIFRMLANKQEGEWTATEVLQRIKENTNILGPVFGNFNFEWLNPMLRDLYWICLQEDPEFPKAPKELHGVPLKIEMVSSVAIALKMGEITAYKEGLQFLMQSAEVNKNVADVVNWDELIRRVFKSLNISDHVLNGEDQVMAMRQSRAQAQQQAQAQEAAPNIAGAVNKLANSPTDGNNALMQLMSMLKSQGGRNAGPQNG